MDQDTKRKMQEALAEKRKRLQDIKDSKKSMAASAAASSSSPSEPAVCLSLNFTLYNSLHMQQIFTLLSLFIIYLYYINKK